MDISVEEQLKILQTSNQYLAQQVSQLSLEIAMLKAELDYTNKKKRNNAK